MNSTNAGTVERSYLRLADAAAKIGTCTEDDLLHLASTGRLELITPRPIAHDVVSAEPFEKTFQDGVHVDFVALDTHQARQLELWGECRAELFPYGYWVLGGGRLGKCEPAEPYGDYGLVQRLSILGSTPDPDEKLALVIVKRSSLFVRVEECNRISDDKPMPEDARQALSRSQGSRASLGTTERNSLLTIIAALCNKAGIDPCARGAAATISRMTESHGTPVSDDTVSRVLTKLAEAVESRMK